MGKQPMETSELQKQMRLMSVESFSKMADGNVLQSGIINTMIDTVFDERVSPIWARRLRSGSKFNLETEIRFQDEYVANYEEKLSERRKALQTNERKEKATLEDFTLEEAEFLKAKETYEAAKARLEKAKTATAHARDVVTDCEAVYQTELERRQSMSKVLLVHASATLAQLQELGYYKFVVTQIDSPVFKTLGIADVVFDEEEAKLIEIEAEDPSLYEDTTQMMLRSRLAYVRMVAWHMLNDVPYELAYADKVIDIILKHNGII